MKRFMKKIFVILSVLFISSLLFYHRQEINMHFTLRFDEIYMHFVRLSYQRVKNNILTSPKNYSEINFINSFADKLIDKKIKMGMGFNELNYLFNNELKRHPRHNRHNEELTGLFVYDGYFYPYFKNGRGEIYFLIHREYGLLWYTIMIVGERINLFEWVALLNKKYGEGSMNNFHRFYWLINENKLPSGVGVVEAFFNPIGGGARIDITYFSKNYFIYNPNRLLIIIKGILERRAGIPPCC